MAFSPSPNPASFGPGSGVTTGFNDDIKSTGLAQLQSTQALATTLLEQSNNAAIDLTGLNFPQVNYTVDFEAIGQLPTLTLPEAPFVTESDFTIQDIVALETRNAPTAPGISNSSLIPDTIDPIPERSIGPAPVVDPDDFIVGPIDDVPDRQLPGKQPIDYTNLGVISDDSDLVNPDLISLEDLERLELRPPIYRNLINALAAKLLYIFDQVTGLPVAWEEATWARARDRLTQEQLAQEDAIAKQFSAAGWDMPTGMETARIDAVRDRFIEAASGVSRDIAIKVFEEALISLRLGLELAARFYELWPTIYQADISAQVETERNKTAQNEQLLQQLRSAIDIFDAKLRSENIRIDARLKVIESKNQTYETDAGVFRTLTERDVSVRQGDIEVEKTRIEAVSESYGAQAEIYDASARALGELIRADVAQQRGEIDIEQLKVGAANEAFRTKSAVYSAEVQGFGVLTNRDVARLDGDIRIEQTRLGSISDFYNVSTNVFASENAQYDSVSRRDVSLFDTETRRQEVASNVQISNNQSLLGERRADVSEAVANARAAADILRQTTAAVWQSTNIGLTASQSENETHSKTIGTSVNYGYSYSEGG